MDLFDFFDMASEIMGFFKAVGEDINNKLHQREVKQGHFANREADGGWTPDELSNAYEPWDFLSEEQWKEILMGDKPLDAFTTSHVWPPHLKEDEPIEDKQEEGSDKVDEGIKQGQNEDSRNAVSVENAENLDDSGEINSVSNSDSEFETDAFESDFDSDYSSGDSGSGNYDGYIG